MAKLIPSNTITANGDYTFDVIPGRLYYFNLGYKAGTGTITVKKRIGFSGTDYDTYKLPSNPAADMALAASGTETGYDIRASSNQIIFTVTLATSLVLKIDIGEIHNGRG
jgi:hypothetical protein